MADNRSAVRVEGLKVLARELGKADKNLRKELGKAYKRMGQWLVPKMQARMRRAGKGAGGSLGAQGIRPSAATTSARINLLGSNPRVRGDEFGSKKYGQFRPWTGNQWGQEFPAKGVGYAVHPTIRENEEGILERFENAIEEALKGAYPERF